MKSFVKLQFSISKIKFVVFPAFKRVEAPPNWDLILNPNSGCKFVFKSWITILISVFDDDLAFVDYNLQNFWHDFFLDLTDFLVNVPDD